MAEITPWFDGSVKPVRPGVYERVPTVKTGFKNQFSFWNGSEWGRSRATVASAAQRAHSKSYEQNTPWRGLTEEATNAR